MAVRSLLEMVLQAGGMSQRNGGGLRRVAKGGKEELGGVWVCTREAESPGDEGGLGRRSTLSLEL